MNATEAAVRATSTNAKPRLLRIVDPLPDHGMSVARKRTTTASSDRMIEQSALRVSWSLAQAMLLPPAAPAPG
jgi:hypothetical protein